MNIWPHLAELRRRFLWCIGACAVFFPLGLCGVPYILNWMARPIGELFFTRPMEAFSAQLQIACGLTFLLALPVILYHSWAFISTGLLEREKRFAKTAVPISYVLFLMGAAFSSFWMVPTALRMLLRMRASNLIPMITVESYLDFFVMSALICGGLFQTPLILSFLSRAGLLEASVLKRHRRVIYLSIVIAASLFNPGTDVLTMVALSCLGIFFFEASILFMKGQEKGENSQKGML